MKKPQKRGRPRFPEEQRRTPVVQVRASPEELGRLEAAAEHDGKPLSTWLRELGLRRAKRLGL